ncbi:phage tail protein [Yersinia enterocolitica]
MANEILPFGLGAESNVMTQAEYEALAARSSGFSSGVAKSEQLNKVWRQSSFMASVLADFIAARSGNDVLDNGNTATLLASLELAIKEYANSNLPVASTLQQGITKLSSLTNSSSETLAATLKAVKTVSDEGLKITGNLAEIKAAGPAAIAEAQSNLDLAALLGDALQKANNLSEIKTAGPAAVAQTLLNLGLGAGGFPIGMPFFWPSATLPNLLLPEWSNMVFLKFNNSSFSATTYPKLAQIFPSLVLPDARGNFPRIWDDGRGLDPGRVLLSQQGDAIRNFSGYIDAVYGQAAANRGGPFYNNAVSAERYNTTKSSGVDTYMNISFEPGRVVPVANENRPVNIAFNLLVRAA